MRQIYIIYMLYNIDMFLYNFEFKVKIFRAEKIETHGGSLRIYIKKDKKTKIENSVNALIKKEENFGIKKYKTYKEFGNKIYKIRENVINNLKNIKRSKIKLIGYGSPAKATTALNFFGISNEIDFIIEDNEFKQGKYIPGVKIPIKSKSSVKNKNNIMLVLAWNFYKEIKNDNKNLSNNFVNIKDLDKVKKIIN